MCWIELHLPQCTSRVTWRAGVRWFPPHVAGRSDPEVNRSGVIRLVGVFEVILGLMGAADSRSRSVSYGLDEQDSVTVIHGVKVTTPQQHLHFKHGIIIIIMSCVIPLHLYEMWMTYSAVIVLLWTEVCCNCPCFELWEYESISFSLVSLIHMWYDDEICSF